MYDLNDMRVQHEEWTLRNFGEKHDGNWAIVGMIEETGELSRALLKQHQGIRGDHDKHEADAKDSVGDYVVFSMAVATVYGIDPNQVRMGAELARPYDTDQGILYGLAYHTGRIGRYHEEQRTVESVVARGDVLTSSTAGRDDQAGDGGPIRPCYLQPPREGNGRGG
jgi:NTP pyrophosphatase (non-canonical NTP hydrolase)